MLMLTSYMDETGHSRDERSKFNGMAGLLCKVEEWELFEQRLAKMLDRFEIPYIHMIESRTMFADWPKNKIEALSREAWDKIEKIRPMPIGSIIPMDEFRKAEDRFRYFFEDPYFIAMQDCMKIGLAPLLATKIPQLARRLAGDDLRVAMVFSDQVEFRHEALQMYETVIQTMPDEFRDKIDPPDFRNMRDWGALQAADMVAYEIYKEREREYYKRPRVQRYGYKRMLAFKNDPPIAVRYHDAKTLADILDFAEHNTRMEEYWKNKRSKKGKDGE